MARNNIMNFVALAGISVFADASYAQGNSPCSLPGIPSGCTIFGSYALDYDSGVNNSGFGTYALEFNTSGVNNTAIGANALTSNTTASHNSAVGATALVSSTTGSGNTAVGDGAMQSNATGNYGTAIGYEALNNSQSGLGNVGVGPFAGKNIVAGQLNIDIGSWGSADESNTIRIGIPQYHLHTYIAGIATTQLTGAQVVVTSSGQLGVLASSERYKTDITTLGTTSERLSQLRPVSFHLKTDPNGALQYGLIAEEVDKVYPELVIRDLEGKIQGVRYDELAPMLLSQAQKQQATIDAQVVKIASLEQQLAGIQVALSKLQPKDELVAQR